MITYRSSAAINRSFVVTEAGAVACPQSEVIVENGLQRAYIFANLFVYDLVEREMNKLHQRVAERADAIVSASGLSPDDVDNLLGNLSLQFRQEIGDNSFDPIIKLHLSQTKKSLTLALTKEEEKQLDETREAICQNEIIKFKKAVLFAPRNDRGRLMLSNAGKPYQVNFSPKYINNLPERCQRFLKPTIKMLAYYDGLQFATFNWDPQEYVLTYTWAEEHPQFDETVIKDEIKSIIAKAPEPDVY